MTLTESLERAEAALEDALECDLEEEHSEMLLEALGRVRHIMNATEVEP